MSSTRRLAISYSRFSDPKQAKGDSEDRQQELFREFCGRHNLTPLTEVFADRGRSGYKDEHRKKGRLGQLLAMAKDDRFEPGTVIVVEAWDRLGRLRPDRQTDLVAELLRTGVSIGICRLDDIFTEDDFGTHKWTTLAVFIQLAYQESKQKAERVARSWEQRRKRTRQAWEQLRKGIRQEGQLLTSRLPAWLELAGKEVRLIPERAAAVKRIFQLAASGHGHTRIVATLEREKVPPFGKVVVREGRSRSQFSGKWTRPYIALVLNDRRAVGEFQPRKMDDTPDGPPLAGYFPAAVTEEEFLLARAGQERRLGKDKAGRVLVARQGKYVNLFKSLLTHARDGEGFVLHNKGSGGAPALVLVNATGNGGRGKCYTFPYHVFEREVLYRLTELDPREVLPREQEAPSKTEVLRARLANVRADVAGLQSDLKQGYSKALAAVLRERETEEERLAGELQEELARSIRPAEKAWQELPTLVNFVSQGGDEARLRLRPVLRRIVEQIVVLIVRRDSHQFLAAQVHFAGGSHRDYLIYYQPAAYRRAGGSWSRSFGAAGVRDGLDLRNPEHIPRLEKGLANLDLSACAEAAAVEKAGEAEAPTNTEANIEANAAANTPAKATRRAARRPR